MSIEVKIDQRTKSLAVFISSLVTSVLSEASDVQAVDV